MIGWSAACGLHTRQGPGILEIGYWVDSDHTRTRNRFRGVHDAGRGGRRRILTSARWWRSTMIKCQHGPAPGVAAKAGFVFGRRASVTECRDTSRGSGIDLGSGGYMTLPGFARSGRNFRGRLWSPSTEVVEPRRLDRRSRPNWCDDIRASPEYAPDLALVAEMDDPTTAGGPTRDRSHVMISACTAPPRRWDSETAIKMLSPLAVRSRRYIETGCWRGAGEDGD